MINAGGAAEHPEGGMTVPVGTGAMRLAEQP